MVFDKMTVGQDESESGDGDMKRELGSARCGLACCLCSENVNCDGCYSCNCPDIEFCDNRKC